MNTDRKFSFVALDFEHYTENQATACAVGMVKVLNNVTVQEYYSLIKPMPDDGKPNGVAGLTEEMLADAPTFPEVWAYLEKQIGDQPIVAHNCATEKSVINKACAYYGLGENVADKFYFVDTYKHTGLSLVESCKKFDVPFQDHHNPLSDARACAEMFLKSAGMEMSKPEPVEKKHQERRERVRGTNADAYVPLPPEDVENKDTIFFGKKVLVTGNFREFPGDKVRESVLMPILKELGATNLRNKVKSYDYIVVADEKAGPSKVDDARSKGVTFVTEDELYGILRDAGKM